MVKGPQTTIRPAVIIAAIILSLQKNFMARKRTMVRNLMSLLIRFSIIGIPTSPTYPDALRLGYDRL